MILDRSSSQSKIGRLRNNVNAGDMKNACSTEQPSCLQRVDESSEQMDPVICIPGANDESNGEKDIPDIIPVTNHHNNKDIEPPSSSTMQEVDSIDVLSTVEDAVDKIEIELAKIKMLLASNLIQDKKHLSTEVNTGSSTGLSHWKKRGAGKLKKKEKRYLNRLSEEWKEPKELLDTLHSLSVFQGHTEVVTLIVFTREDKIVPGSDTHSIEVWKLRNVFITFEDDSRPMAMNTNDKGRIAFTDLLHYLLPDNIKKFQVVKSEKTNQPSAASDRLAHLVNEMKKNHSSKATSRISEKSLNIQSTVKKSLTANKIKEKKVTVGFKYRSSQSMNYAQLKKGQGGGLQDLTLCNTKEYTVAEIIELSKSQFLAKEKLSSVYLEGSTIKLGLFSGEPFDNFLDDGGNKIDLWKFIENNKSGGVPLKLYLYVCQPVHPESHEAKLALALSQDSSFNKTSTPVTEEHSDLIKKRKFSSIDDCQYSDVSDINFDENHQENKKCMLSSDIVSIEPTNSQQDDDNNNNNNNNDDDDYDVENLFEIFIEYYEISISDYSHKESITTLRKKDIWEQKEHHIYPPIDYSNFYPLEHGVFLASISRNNEKLLHIYQDDLGQNVYSFPCLKELPVPHSVLHKCEELFGKYEDTFGFGIITACTTTCNPQYKWYCNGIPIASGPHLP
ncbi:hypothetical protein HCN44_000823 [Aphidius gifuensis]|uniref:Uncharacterized protein n=1 Tax=Aphidius gifuensis TaxID=684658 RepID=A0A834XPF6_APHGI|nr:hypothetical protein HCN44_000823 [Aphidius gifuensis]